MIKKIIVPAFFLFILGEFIYNCYQIFQESKEQITASDEYRQLHETMLSEQEPMLDGLEKMMKHEEEFNRVRATLLEIGLESNEEQQYQLGKFFGSFQYSTNRLQSGVSEMKDLRKTFKNHNDMEMDSIKADFQKMSEMNQAFIENLNIELERVDKLILELSDFEKSQTTNQ